MLDLILIYFSLLLSVDLNYVVIPEFLCRESSDFIAFKVAGSPTKAFGDDGFVALNSHASSELLRSNNMLVKPITELQHKLMRQH